MANSLNQSKPTKDFWVVFTNNNARIVKVNPDFDRQLPNVKNPDLSAVKGLPPHLWKLVNNQVVRMTSKECVNRNDEVALTGVDNNTKPLSKNKFVNIAKRRLQKSFLYGILVGIGICGIILILKQLLA